MALYYRNRANIGELTSVLGLVGVEVVKLLQLLADVVILLELLAR